MAVKCAKCGKTFSRKDVLKRHQESGACLKVRKVQEYINRDLGNIRSNIKGEVKINPEVIDLDSIRKIRIGDKTIMTEDYIERGSIKLPIGKEIISKVYWTPEEITKMANDTAELYKTLVKNQINQALIQARREQKNVQKVEVVDEPIVKIIRWAGGGGIIFDGLRRIIQAKSRSCDVEALNKVSEEGREISFGNVTYVDKKDVRYISEKYQCEREKWINTVVGALEIFFGSFVIGYERLIKPLMNLLGIKSFK
jgi:hypothetical protein